MLELDGLRVEQDGFRLEAELAVPTGARVAVIGASGAGKSTLLGAIAGFVPLAGGEVRWAGRRIDGLKPGARPLSILFQDQNLFPHLTLWQNVGLGLHPGLRLVPADRVKVDAALDRVGLAALAGRKPGQVSGGEQGRAALARLLLRARPLWLMDEPFAALGPALKAAMLDLATEIAGETGATVLMVSHAPEDALRFAPETIVVAAGRALPPRPTAALLSDPPPDLADYLGRK